VTDITTHNAVRGRHAAIKTRLALAAALFALVLLIWG
jgi:hypothetical protein